MAQPKRKQNNNNKQSLRGKISTTNRENSEKENKGALAKKERTSVGQNVEKLELSKQCW